MKSITAIITSVFEWMNECVHFWYDGDGGDAEKSPPLFFAPKLQPFLDCIRQNIAELKLQICGGFFSFRIKARKRE